MIAARETGFITSNKDRLADGRSFMPDVTGTCGQIYHAPRDGKTFELFATGFRNAFDASLNAKYNQDFAASQTWAMNRPRRSNTNC